MPEEETSDIAKFKEKVFSNKHFYDEINLLNAAFDQFISDTTAWELTDPKVQEKKQDLLNKVREGTK